jgi:hypothetical protein
MRSMRGGFIFLTCASSDEYFIKVVHRITTGKINGIVSMEFQ